MRESSKYMLRPAWPEETGEIFSRYESLGCRAAGRCENGTYVGVKRQKEL